MKTLLCIHTKAGGGQEVSRAETLRDELERFLGMPVTLALANSHGEVSSACKQFLRVSPGPALLLGGGGSGTARAVVDGVLAVEKAVERAKVAFLRLGSGNILARQFGVPKQPELALRGIAWNARAGRSAPCTVMRCTLTDVYGRRSVRHAASLVGLGELARVPAELQAFKATRGWHAALGRVVGIERRNRVDYVLFTARRLGRGLFQPARLDRAQVDLGGKSQNVRLLAGAVMNFPVSELPLPAKVRVEEPRLTLHLLEGRPQVHTEPIEEGQTLRIDFENAEGGAVFLDEDTLVGVRRLELSALTGLRAVPGPDYRFPTTKE